MKSAALDTALRELGRPQVGDERSRPVRTTSSPGAELGPFIVAHALGASREAERWTLACGGLGTFGLALFAAAPTLLERALALGVVVLAGVGTVLARRGRRVLLVHGHGFVVAEDSVARGCGYAEISRLFVAEAPRGEGSLALTIHAGARAPLGLEARDPSGVRALRELVRRAAPILLPRLSADLYAGADCDFGALHLSRARLAIDGRRGRDELALSDVARVALERGRLVIDADRAAPRRFAEVPAASVANLDVLEPLLRRVCPTAELALSSRAAPRPRRSR